MKNFTTNAFILLGSMLIGASCHQEEVTAPVATSVDHFTVDNELVSFKSAADFRSQIKELQKLSPSDLIAWNKKTSVTSLFEVAQSKDSSRARVAAEGQSQADLSDAVHDKYFASLLNSNGEFCIGKKIIRITANVVFIGDKASADQVRAMDPSRYSNLAPNKFITEKGVLIGRASHLAKNNANARMAFNGVDHTIYEWDGSHRVATVIYNDNWLAYRSIGTKVKFQNKRWWGGWWEDNTDALSMHYSVTYDVSRVTGIQQYVTVNPPSQSCQNCGNITDTIDFDIAETGWGGDGPSISLIDSPYDFKSFVTYSSGTWRGNTHTDSLEEDQ